MRSGINQTLTLMHQLTPIRVLVVDDSFFMRKLLCELLEKDPSIEVVGNAKDGIEALGQAVKLKPDVITMDLNMPRMNGLTATGAILKEPGHLPAIVMISAFTAVDAKETLECLRAGAVDYVQKPSGELSLDIEKIADEIIRKIKMAARAHVYRHKEIPLKDQKEKVEIRHATKVIVIGASTGGPPVVEDIIAGLPVNLGAAVLIAQHMPGYFTDKFAARLDGMSSLPVKEAEDSEAVKANTVYLTPGGFDTTLVRKAEDGRCFIKLKKVENTKGKLVPSIDRLMESAAEVYSGKVLGIELTGMGKDGLAGAKAIKKSGGYFIAQSPDTAVVSSMPDEIIEAKLANEILSPKEIIKRIGEIIHNYPQNKIPHNG
jgi:two-component system, chemotaxis family, protein-glutamate methylesterase/glutaminase